MATNRLQKAILLTWLDKGSPELLISNENRIQIKAICVDVKQFKVIAKETRRLQRDSILC